MDRRMPVVRIQRPESSLLVLALFARQADYFREADFART